MRLLVLFSLCLGAIAHTSIVVRTQHKTVIYDQPTFRVCTEGVQYGNLCFTRSGRTSLTPNDIVTDVTLVVDDNVIPYHRRPCNGAQDLVLRNTCYRPLARLNQHGFAAVVKHDVHVALGDADVIGDNLHYQTLGNTEHVLALNRGRIVDAYYDDTLQLAAKRLTPNVELGLILTGFINNVTYTEASPPFNTCGLRWDQRTLARVYDVTDDCSLEFLVLYPDGTSFGVIYVHHNGADVWADLNVYRGREAFGEMRTLPAQANFTAIVAYY